MTLLRLAIAVVFSLALHAALAAVLSESIDKTAAGMDPQSNAVTLVLIETPSDAEEEAAPSPEPGAETVRVSDAEPEADGGNAPETAETEEQPAPTHTPVTEAAAENTPQPAPPVDAAPAVAENGSTPEPEAVTAGIPARREAAIARPAEIAALASDETAPAGPAIDSEAEPEPRVGAPEAEPAVTLPQTVALIPRARPAPQAEAAPPRERDPGEQAKPVTPKTKAEPKRKSARAPAGGSRGTDSAGDGKVVSARSSVRAIAAYGRRINAHVARHKQAASGRGTVALTIRVNRAGRLVGATLSSSSGNTALDKAALSTARRAAPYPAPPADVQGSTVALRIRLSFR